MKLWQPMARGFTLIEIAIVLVVIGLILSGGLLTVSPILQNSRVADTKSKLAFIEKALIVHTIQHGCMPCPANAALATGAANFGQSLNAASGLSGTCTADECFGQTAGQNGVVPWLALGLSEADITDAWGNRITYQLSGINTVTNCTDGSAIGTRNTNLQTAGAFARTTAGGTACYPAGRIRVEDAATNVITAGGAAEGAAFVLVSHGPDGEGAYKANTASLQASPSNSTPQGENTDNDTTFVQDNPIGIEGAGYFDDIVVWRSAPLIIQMCGDGGCGN